MQDEFFTMLAPIFYLVDMYDRINFLKIKVDE